MPEIRVLSTEMPKAGDVIEMVNETLLKSLPFGTILEAESDFVATLAYRVMDSDYWTFSGFSQGMPSAEMADMTNKSDVQWLVVRVGEHKDE